ncbi:MAG: DEAD/DEAH box helicase family protein [Pyrinomonadaceae bacterium]
MQQLVQARFWQTRSRRSGSHSGPSDSPEIQRDVALPEQWKLIEGLALHEWQERCVDAWFNNAKRGVIKVVTGAGKTILALAIAQRLQREENQLRIAVVVPTTVLLEQWREEFANRSNLPLDAIGLMGGGHDVSFDERVRVLICVLNSAAKKLPGIVERSGIAESLLLVVDECHRAGAAQMQHVFKTRRKYNLGLSATPERDEQSDVEDIESFKIDQDEQPIAFEDSKLGRELGNVIFELNYAEAIRLGVLPPFMIVHYGLSLLPTERTKYERVSREIKDLRSELETSQRRGLALIRWCRSKAASGNPKAARLIGLTSERKRLVYRMKERSAAVLRILERAFEQNPATKAILFHESIEEVMNLFGMLRNKGFAVVAEHSEFPDDVRAESLRLFRHGTAQVIVSAKSLIEGFNIPSADLGIIVAASSSVRQRVQTLGRLLRRVQHQDGSEKEACLYVLYANQTVDELIYEKADWGEFVGADRNDYFLWSQVDGSEPEPKTGPPRAPTPSEFTIDVGSLNAGESYPGNLDEGKSYSLDMQGNISDENGRFLKPSIELRAILKNSRKKGGRFRVTPMNQFVIELNKTKDGWQGIYLGRLTQRLHPADSDSAEDQTPTHYSPGDLYPLDRVQGKSFSVLQRDKRLVAAKARDGIRFVIDEKSIADADKQNALRNIQEFLARAYGAGHRISKITVTEEGHVVYVYNNEAYFVGYAPEGPQGFIFEDRP